MTSKEYLPLRHKSISAASKLERRHYALRTHIIKVHKYTAGSSASSACNQNRILRKRKRVPNTQNEMQLKLKRVPDTQKSSTSSNDAIVAECQQTPGLQSSSDGGMDAVDIVEDTDIAGFADMVRTTKKS